MKRAPLKTKTPLRSRAAKPKAKRVERTAHLGRMKRRATSKTAEEAAHLERVAGLPCLICHRVGPSTVHHVRHKITRSGTFARSHQRVVPLCPACHQHDHGKESVERVHEAGIYERTGIDMWAEAEKLWDER